MTYPLRCFSAVCLASLSLAASLRAQFSPALLQNDSYWGDGRAEVDLYDARIMREGQPRPCEMTLILTQDTLIPQVTAGSTPAPRTEPITGIRMSQMFTAPIGLSAEQHSLSLFWSSAAELLEGSLFMATGKGNRTVLLDAFPAIRSLCAEVRNERGEVDDRDLSFLLHGAALLYDELPLRVRTIAFTKPAAEFEFAIASPLTNPGPLGTARASYHVNDRAIEITVRQGDALDRFVLDRDFPFLLREWSARDGSQFKLKTSLKADLRNYRKNGDRERALKDPMLRHPD